MRFFSYTLGMFIYDGFITVIRIAPVIVIIVLIFGWQGPALLLRPFARLPVGFIELLLLPGLRDCAEYGSVERLDRVMGRDVG